MAGRETSRHHGNRVSLHAWTKPAWPGTAGARARGPGGTCSPDEPGPGLLRKGRTRQGLPAPDCPQLDGGCASASGVPTGLPGARPGQPSRPAASPSHQLDHVINPRDRQSHPRAPRPETQSREVFGRSDTLWTTRTRAQFSKDLSTASPQTARNAHSEHVKPVRPRPTSPVHATGPRCRRLVSPRPPSCARGCEARSGPSRASPAVKGRRHRDVRGFDGPGQCAPRHLGATPASFQGGMVAALKARCDSAGRIRPLKAIESAGRPRDQRREGGARSQGLAGDGSQARAQSTLDQLCHA